MLALLTILGVFNPIFWILWIITSAKWALVLAIVGTSAVIAEFVHVIATSK